MTELGAFLLPVVPLLILVICLLAGRYPGYDAIVRFAESIDPSSKPTTTVVNLQRPAPPRSHAVCGGLLIAFSLAKRPPPLAH